MISLLSTRNVNSTRKTTPMRFSAQRVEATSLLDNEDAINVICHFVNLESLNNFLDEYNLKKYMVVKKEENNEETGTTTVTWTTPFPYGNPFLLRYEVKPNGSGRLLGFPLVVGKITKLYQVTKPFIKKTYCVTKQEAWKMTCQNRLERLKRARLHLLLALRVQQAKAKAAVKQRYALRMYTVESRYETESNALYDGLVCTEVGPIRYQYDAQLQLDLTDALDIAYCEQGETASGIRQFLGQPVTVSLFDRSSGFNLVEGDLLALGRLPGGLERVVELVNAARRRITETREDGGADSSSNVIDELKTRIQELTEEARTQWTESRLVDPQGRKKKATVKSLRASVAAKKEPCPVVRMTMKQYYALRNLYTADVFRTITWRTTLRREEVRAQVRELMDTYCAFPTPWVKTQMQNRGVSKSMLQKVFDNMEGKGMSDTDEVNSILEISGT